MSTDRQQQIDQVRQLLAAGWRLERDWTKIRARYQDTDLADAVPRPLMYVDLGVLIARVVQLENIIHAHGWDIAPTEDLDDGHLAAVLAALAGED